MRFYTKLKCILGINKSTLANARPCDWHRSIPEYYENKAKFQEAFKPGNRRMGVGYPLLG